MENSFSDGQLHWLCCHSIWSCKMYRWLGNHAFLPDVVAVIPNTTAKQYLLQFIGTIHFMCLYDETTVRCELFYVIRYKRSMYIPYRVIIVQYLSHVRVLWIWHLNNIVGENFSVRDFLSWAFGEHIRHLTLHIVQISSKSKAHTVYVAVF